jgi:hypothetical protein
VTVAASWSAWAGHTSDAKHLCFGGKVVERSVRISAAAAADRPDSEDETDLLVDTVPQRLYTYQEIELLARLTGFEVAAVHGGLDIDVSVDSDDSYALVVCLRRSS